MYSSNLVLRFHKVKRQIKKKNALLLGRRIFCPVNVFQNPNIARFLSKICILKAKADLNLTGGTYRTNPGDRFFFLCLIMFKTVNPVHLWCLVSQVSSSRMSLASLEGCQAEERFSGENQFQGIWL